MAEMCRNPRGPDCSADGGGSHRDGDGICSGGYRYDHIDGTAGRSCITADIHCGTSGV